MRALRTIVAILTASLCLAPNAAMSNTAGRVTGIGGVVVASKNPRALAAWYRDVLGISIQTWGGAMFPYDAPAHPPYTVWSALPNSAKEFAHSRRDFMINLSVDDLEALCTRLTAKASPSTNDRIRRTGSLHRLSIPTGRRSNCGRRESIEYRDAAA